jgi:hypothetical protein
MIASIMATGGWTTLAEYGSEDNKDQIISVMMAVEGE